MVLPQHHLQPSGWLQSTGLYHLGRASPKPQTSLGPEKALQRDTGTLSFFPLGFSFQAPHMCLTSGPAIYHSSKTCRSTRHILGIHPHVPVTMATFSQPAAPSAGILQQPPHRSPCCSAAPPAYSHAAAEGSLKKKITFITDLSSQSMAREKHKALSNPQSSQIPSKTITNPYSMPPPPPPMWNSPTETLWLLPLQGLW